MLSKLLVPEDSVTPETQTLIVFKRRKGLVGCLYFYNLIYKNKYKLESYGG